MLTLTLIYKVPKKGSWICDIKRTQFHILTSTSLRNYSYVACRSTIICIRGIWDHKFSDFGIYCTMTSLSPHLYSVLITVCLTFVKTVWPQTSCIAYPEVQQVSFILMMLGHLHHIWLDFHLCHAFSAVSASILNKCILWRPKKYWSIGVL